MRLITQARSHPIPFTVGAFLCTAAEVLFLSIFVEGWLNAKPLRLELNGDDKITSSEFRVQETRGYRAVLEIDRKFPFRETECLLGVGMPDPLSSRSGLRTDCPSDFPPADLEWAIMKDGRPLPIAGKVPAHDGKYGNDTIARELGFVALRNGQLYSAEAQLRHSNTNLKQAAPRLIIYLNPDDQNPEGAILAVGFKFVLSVLFALAGVASLIYGLLRQ